MNTCRFIASNIWGDYFGNPPHERDTLQSAVLLRHAADIAPKRSECCSWHGDPKRDAQGIYRGARKAENDTRDFSLDHILVDSAKVEALEHRVILDQDALDASDHSPVMLDFRLP